MRLVELDPQAEPYWEDLLAGEQEPWGGVGERLSWRDKTRNLGLRRRRGNAAGGRGDGARRARTAAAGTFEVAGLGGLVVSAARGDGASRGSSRGICSSSRASSPSSARCCSASPV